MLSRGPDHNDCKMERPDVLFLQPVQGDNMQQGSKTRIKSRTKCNIKELLSTGSFE